MRRILLAGLLLLAACQDSASPPIEGVVTGKVHRAAYTTYIKVKNYQVPSFYPETWTLVVCRSHDCVDVRVEAGVYNRTEIGQWYQKGE